MILDLQHVQLTIGGDPLVTIRDWRIGRGKVYGLMGQTGSGKSTIGKWLANIEPVYWQVDLQPESESGSRNDSSSSHTNSSSLYLLQDAYQIFNPYVSIGRHFRDIWNHNRRNSRLRSFDEILEILRALGITDPHRIMKRKVGGVSQGEAQRLAFALSFIRPADLRIYDEVFSNVDMESSRRMLDFLLEYCERTGTSAVVISHEKALLREYMHENYEIRSGEVIPTALEARVRSLESGADSFPLLIHIRDLAVPDYGRGKRSKRMLATLPELRIGRGECVGLHGRSGTGKTTLLRGLLGEHPLTWSECRVERSLGEMGLELGDLDIRYLPQSVGSAFNPAYPLGTSIREIQSVRGISDQEVAELLASFGLKAGHMDRYPDELSGGEIQRMGIISVMLGTPDLVMLDESFSSVDEYTRDAIWSVLVDLQKQKGFAVLVVSHDVEWLEGVVNYELRMTNDEWGE